MIWAHAHADDAEEMMYRGSFSALSNLWPVATWHSQHLKSWKQLSSEVDIVDVRLVISLPISMSFPFQTELKFGKEMTSRSEVILLLLFSFIFSCPHTAQLVTWSLTDWSLSHCTDLWDIWSEWWENMTWPQKTYIPTYLTTYLPTYLCTSIREHPKRAILRTCDIWDTDYNSDNWEPEFMTIFVIWQLIVTLDSIRNSCDVTDSTGSYHINVLI